MSYGNPRKRYSEKFYRCRECGYEASRYSYYRYGICSDCRKRENKEEFKEVKKFRKALKKGKW